MCIGRWSLEECDTAAGEHLRPAHRHLFHHELALPSCPAVSDLGAISAAAFSAAAAEVIGAAMPAAAGTANLQRSVHTICVHG